MLNVFDHMTWLQKIHIYEIHPFIHCMYVYVCEGGRYIQCKQYLQLSVLVEIDGYTPESIFQKKQNK